MLWWLQDIDLDTSVEGGMKKLIDAAGAGASFTSPGWLTQLGRLWGGKSVRRQTSLLDSLAGLRAAECISVANGSPSEPPECDGGRALGSWQNVPAVDHEPLDTQDAAVHAAECTCAAAANLSAHQPAIAGRPGGRCQASRHPGPAGRRAVQGAVQVDGGDGARVPAAHRRGAAAPPYADTRHTLQELCAPAHHALCGTAGMPANTAEWIMNSPVYLHRARVPFALFDGGLVNGQVWEVCVMVYDERMVCQRQREHEQLVGRLSPSCLHKSPLLPVGEAPQKGLPRLLGSPT